MLIRRISEIFFTNARVVSLLDPYNVYLWISNSCKDIVCQMHTECPLFAFYGLILCRVASAKDDDATLTSYVYNITCKLNVSST